MSNNLKSIADTTLINESTDTTNLLVEEDGEIKRLPASAIAGNSRCSIFFEFKSDYTFSHSYEEIKNAVLSGQHVVGYYYDSNYQGLMTFLYPSTHWDNHIKFYSPQENQHFIIYDWGEWCVEE